MNQTSPVVFAPRMGQLPPYLFGMINEIKMRKRLMGEDVIDLGMGNPTDPTPEPIIGKLCEVVQDPKSHRYPVAQGLRNLRREIAKSYDKDYGVKLDSEAEVICTIGSKEAISHMCLAVVGPGDNVLVPAPAFPIHIYASVIAGGNVIRIPLEDDTRFLERIAMMCESVIPRPKVLILNYPHNPTGTVVDMGFFAEIAAMAKKYRFAVLQDFAYAKITFDGYKAPSFLEADGAKDVGVEFGTFSKSYNMAGWRIGYCVGNASLIKGLAKIKGYYDYGVFSPVQISSIVALRDCDDDVAKQVSLYESRRDTLCRGLAGMGWDVEPPKAGMFVWARIPEPFRRMGSMEFVLHLAEHGNVTMSPGIGFGEEGEGYVRIAIVENEHRIRQALKQMRRCLRDLESEDLERVSIDNTERPACAGPGA
ncbi:MAG TPA: aminotransferase class I/II-fold pyridoxal phosphate-dependent enzyme [Desulfobacteraceae bacterium]|nr:aminotransferase class I/II-fold pyridoxal phosphate-dependent enzyme [Desulfobacteraceae bacterium]